MKQVIGFTEKYYTLWMVNESETDGYYVKNLSMDLDIAKSKVEGEYEVDLERRGTTWTFPSYCELPDAEADEFSFGMFRNQKIMETGNHKVSKDRQYIIPTDDDIWQLERAAKSETTPERQELAVKRLMELDSKYDFVPFRDGYWDRKERDEILEHEAEETRKANLKRGHFFNDKDKVELELRTLEAFGFDGSYGYCNVRTYESKCGRIFKYLGSCPPDLNELEYHYTKSGKRYITIEDDSFYKVSATIKHSEYKTRVNVGSSYKDRTPEDWGKVEETNEKETRLIRIKVEDE